MCNQIVMDTKSVVLLLTFFLVGVCSKTVDPTSRASDLIAALTFIQCTQKALISGLPEVDIPSYDPLVVTQNVSFNYTFLSSKVNIDLTNISMRGFTNWTLIEAQQTLSDDPDVDIFRFKFNWPSLSTYMNWLHIAQKPDVKYIARGSLNLELRNANFTIGWTSTKPGSGRNGTLDEFTLDINTETARVTITNLSLLDYLINVVGGPMLAQIVNNNPLAGAITQVAKVTLIEDWINKPEKIDAINANC